ncbi:MAG: hypothetical protein JWP14_634 [Frankiales bacterium]|nr:hypothetical protein [Frankiales bacterium]
MKSRPAPSVADQRAVLEALEELESEKARLHARGLQLRAELAQLWADERSGFAELELAGTALVGQYRAARELDDATRAADNFPRLSELLAEGAVFVPTAELLLEATRRCTPEVQARVDSRLSGQLVGRNASDCRRLVAATVLAVEAEIDPKLTQDRLDAAKKGARIWVSPGADGMTAIGAVLDAVAGRRWALDFEQLVRAQRLLDRRAGADRTLDEVRAEVFAHLPSLVLELVRAARDGRLAELAELDDETAAELAQLAQDTVDLPLPDEAPTDAAVDAGTGEIRVEVDPYDESIAAQDPYRDLPWTPGEEPSDVVPEAEPPPSAAAAQDAASRDSLSSATTLSTGPPDPTVVVLLLRCLQLPLDNPTVVNLHVPMATALDLTDAPGHLDGHGPLDARRLRLLLPDAHLREVYVDHTGVPLGSQPRAERPRPGQADLVELARRLRAVVLVDDAEPQHDPSTALAEQVKLRDQRCDGPGCTMPASRCDLDHEIRWPDGPTAEWNLKDRSRRCHQAKHGGWHAERHEDGSTDWTSPTGRTYTSYSQWQPPPAVSKRPGQVTYVLPPTTRVLELETEHAG